MQSVYAWCASHIQWRRFLDIVTVVVNAAAPDGLLDTHLSCRAGRQPGWPALLWRTSGAKQHFWREKPYRHKKLVKNLSMKLLQDCEHLLPLCSPPELWRVLLRYFCCTSKNRNSQYRHLASVNHSGQSFHFNQMEYNLLNSYGDYIMYIKL